MLIRVLCSLGLATLLCTAQDPAGVVAQRAAMKKLAFLEGRWSGPAKVRRGPGPPMALTQNESVSFKLDGLVLLVEGWGDRADGQTVFRALSTIAYDPATSQYRFRAYHDGNYLDTELTVTEKGFAWGYSAGPLKVTNTMRLTDGGEWEETTLASYAGNAPTKSVEMKLSRKPL